MQYYGRKWILFPFGVVAIVSIIGFYAGLSPPVFVGLGAVTAIAALGFGLFNEERPDV
jgi:hypothetical protein